MTDFERLVSDAVSDPARLRAVRATGLLDTVPDGAFDALTDAAATALGSEFAFVTIVDDHRSYWKSCIGLPPLSIGERQNRVEESFCQYVIGLGSAFLIDDARLDERTRNNPAVDSLGVIAWAGQPIMSSDGHVLGSFCVMDSSPRAWSKTDEQLLAAFAGSASREVQLWTRLVELEGLTRRAEGLSAFTGSLAAHISTDAALELMVSQLPELLGTELVTIATLMPGGAEARVRHSMAVSTELTEQFARLPLDVPTPLTDSIVTGEFVLVANSDEGKIRYPHLDAAARSAGVVTSASIPLRLSDGSVLGALGMAWMQARVVEGIDRSIIEAVASLCAQTIERTRLADASKDLSTALTRQLLPAVPDIPGLDIAVRYLPADDRLAFGGDWYDVISADGARVVLIVGDVVGHGVEAAARMSEIRVVLHTLVKLGVPLERILTDADVLLEHLHETYLATVVLVEIDVDQGTLRHVSCGHPPIIIRASDGDVSMNSGSKRPPLGLGGHVSDVTKTPLAPGSVVVAYTDGLVERRGTDFDEGLRRVRVTLADSGGVSSDQICDELLGTLTDERRDDVAVIVVST